MNKELIDKIKTLYEKGQRSKALNTLLDRIKEEPKPDIESLDKLIELSMMWIETESTSQAYQIRGRIFRELKDFLKAITAYDKAIEIESKSDIIYNNRGNTYCEFKEYKKAILDYSKAIELESEDAIYYYNRARAYTSLNENENEKAILDYNIAIEINPKYVDAYNNRGLAYSELNEDKKAINDFNEAIKIDPNYITAYNNRGLTYNGLKEYQKAIHDFNKAIEINPKNADFYYSRGLSYKKLEKYENALDDFNKHIEIGDTEYWIEKSQNHIKEVEEIQKNSIIKELNKNIDEIKNILEYEGDEITHYTGLTTSELLIGDRNSLFRLSESNFLNDTSEGQRLNTYLAQNNGKPADSTAIAFVRKPFIGSFVPGDKSNDLTLWRMYAKENQEEAKGCSLTIHRNDFINNIKTKVINGDKESKLNDEDFKFYRVSYLKEDNTCIIPGANAKEVNLAKALVKLRKTVRKIIKRDEQELNLQVKERLSEIQYLFKGDAYVYECEIRLVMSGIGIEKKCSELNTSPKVYIEIASIRSALKSITIGPKVERAEEWAALFHYQLNQDSKQETEIKLSQLPFK